MVNPAFNRAHEKRRYWQVRPCAGYGWATFEKDMDAIEYVTDGFDPSVPYEIREVWLTLDEFESMPEHGGW